MSRRPLALALIALASLVASACSASPTAPRQSPRVAAFSVDSSGTPLDSTSRSGWSGSF